MLVCYSFLYLRRFFLSSFYVKENDFKYGPKGYFSWPKDIEVHGLWIFGCSLVVHRLASIWSWTSTRLSFGCTKRNQSWSKVYMRSPKNQVSPMEGVCLELVSPIWSTIVQLSQLCFMEQTSLSLSFFLSYIRKKNVFPQVLYDFGLEGAMQTKRDPIIQQLL